ncbi:MAG: response regulator transcription factor [Candidatus Zipacnadales bacterium]
MKVLLGIPHALLREGIRDILKRWSTVHVVGSAPSAADAVRLLERLRPDVLVISPSKQPARDSQAILTARRGNAPCKVVLLEGVEGGVRGESLGADCAVPANVGPAGFIRAMCGVCQEQEPDAFLQGKENSPSLEVRNFPEPKPLLTRREYEIIRTLCEGRSNQEIATQLGISEKTVKNHLFHIYHRIGLKRRTELILWAFEHGLVGDSE